jgi:predicted RNA binding protein YcfA (HicA-like mRNA interferase family)
MIKGKHKIFIPNPHGSKDIGIPLLKKIIRQIGITQDEFIKL